MHQQQACLAMQVMACKLQPQLQVCLQLVNCLGIGHIVVPTQLSCARQVHRPDYLYDHA